jgi:cbb3-type cytochrome oxidase cytochrome c subunit
MKYGPLVFLAAFFALASSWCGFVMTPQLQIGRLQPTNTLGGTAVTYPVAPPGLARQGMEVYRANGCVYCHSQQVGQSGTVVDIALTDAGTNQAATVAALLSIANAAKDPSADLTPLPALALGKSSPTDTNLLRGLPKAFFRSSSPKDANAALQTLNATSAKGQLWIVPVGPDIARGWGKRHSVAEDFLFDSPVMPGSQRVGPDLADVGTRLPDAHWHLLHLYAPQLQAKGSIMPPYRFLFEQREAKGRPSPDALVLPGDLAPPKGYEVVPTPAAKALAAYLISLHADAPLFVAPLSVASAAAATTTNATASAEAATTNAAPPQAPAK